MLTLRGGRFYTVFSHTHVSFESHEMSHPFKNIKLKIILETQANQGEAAEDYLPL